MMNYIIVYYKTIPCLELITSLTSSMFTLPNLLIIMYKKINIYLLIVSVCATVPPGGKESPFTTLST